MFNSLSDSSSYTEDRVVDSRVLVVLCRGRFLEIRGVDNRAISFDSSPPACPALNRTQAKENDMRKLSIA